MNEVLFTFRGKPCKTHLQQSPEAYPHFYWCFFDDPSLIEEMGDCVAFQRQDDGAVSPFHFYPREHADLVELLQGAVELYIADQAGT